MEIISSECLRRYSKDVCAETVYNEISVVTLEKRFAVVAQISQIVPPVLDVKDRNNLPIAEWSLLFPSTKKCDY